MRSLRETHGQFSSLFKKLKNLLKNTKIISVDKIKVLALYPDIILQRKTDTSPKNRNNEQRRKIKGLKTDNGQN